MHVGYSDVSPRAPGRDKILGGPKDSAKNPDGPNFGTYVFIHVCRVYICTYIIVLAGGLKAWTRFYLFFPYIYKSNYFSIYAHISESYKYKSYFFFGKKTKEKESKKRERNTENSNPTGFELHKPSIMSTELLFKVIKAIIIIKFRTMGLAVLFHPSTFHFPTTR